MQNKRLTSSNSVGMVSGQWYKYEYVYRVVRSIDIYSRPIAGSFFLGRQKKKNRWGLKKQIFSDIRTSMYTTEYRIPLPNTQSCFYSLPTAPSNLQRKELCTFCLDLRKEHSREDRRLNISANSTSQTSFQDCIPQL